MIVSRRIVPSAAAAGLASVAAAGAQHTGDIAQPDPPGRGGWDIGPRDLIWDGENSDVLVPPGTDSGTLPDLRFSFADAHNRPASSRPLDRHKKASGGGPGPGRKCRMGHAFDSMCGASCQLLSESSGRLPDGEAASRVL